MSELINIDEVIRNTRRYWYIDGIVEIAVGTLITFIAVSYYLTSLISNIAFKSILLGLVQPAIIIIGAIVVRKVITWLKEHLTYPRTGYLAFNKHPEHKRIQRKIKIVFVAVIVSVMVSFITQLLPIKLMPLISVILICLLTIYLGYQNAVTRFYIVAFVLFVVGLVITLIGLSEVLSFVTLYASIGLVWIVSGIITLSKYLRKTTPVKEAS